VMTLTGRGLLHRGVDVENARRAAHLPIVGTLTWNPA
jgi:hypothetical protein